MRSVVLSAIVALALGGCATPYGAYGLTGGVTAEALSSDTYRIHGVGNGFTSADTIRDFVMLKAAETAKGAGCTYFAILNSDGATQTVMAPGLLMVINKPAEEIVVRVLKAPAPGAHNAEEIIASVGPRVRRS